MVEEIENPPADFPRWAYNLTAFSDLPFPHTYPPNLTDVIGAITSVSDIRTSAFPGRLVPIDRRIIQIKDLSGQEIQIILTGAAARKFDARTILDEGATESEVAIFVGTFVRNYLGTKAQYGNVTLSWYVNEDIPEINAFRASIAATPVVGGPLPDQFVLRRQFDGIIPHKTLDALIYPDLFANEAPLKAQVSREVLLKEIASSLQLKIHLTDTFSESFGRVRAWIDIDFPRTGTQGTSRKKRFYSELKESKRHAIENAAQAAITHLLLTENVTIHDANYERAVILEAKLKAARSFEELFKSQHNVAAKHAAQLKKDSEQVMLKIVQICANSVGILPLKVSGWKSSMTQLEDVMVQYIGQPSPETENEKLATSLMQLLPVNMTSGLPSFDEADQA